MFKRLGGTTRFLFGRRPRLCSETALREEAVVRCLHQEVPHGHGRPADASCGAFPLGLGRLPAPGGRHGGRSCHRGERAPSGSALAARCASHLHRGVGAVALQVLEGAALPSRPDCRRLPPPCPWRAQRRTSRKARRRPPGLGPSPSGAPRSHKGAPASRGERGEGHMRQDKPGFLLITCRYAAIGIPSCLLALQR